MAEANVSSCVLNILGSFASSTGLFKKLRDGRGKRRRSKKDQKLDDEEQRLSLSLSRGPEDIGREYQKNVHAAGDQFAIGDAIAQTCLAEILLRLNVGLVGIITSFVHSDKNDLQLDYQSLTDLSERSRVDTCRTLRQLFKRMTELRVPFHMASKADVVPANPRVAKDDNFDRSRNPRKATKGGAKVRGPTLARVVIENSKKPSKIAIVKPGVRRKQARSSVGSGSGSSSLSKARSQSRTTLSTPASTPLPEYAPEHAPRPMAQRSKTAPDAAKPRRKASAMNIADQRLPSAGGALRATRSTPRLQSTLPQLADPLPPMPNSAPMGAASTLTLPPRRRKPTPTYYSIASDSTRLGEIPMHKWAAPYDFDQMSILNREAERNGWPIDPLENQENRPKRSAFFRLFRKKST